MTLFEETHSVSCGGDSEMRQILETMIEANETITAREVARRHPSLQHASSITRSQQRRELLERFKAMQQERREWVRRLPKYSDGALAARLADKDAQIMALRRQVEILRASHVAMLRVVGELGGMGKWLRFFEPYHEIREEIKQLGLLPEPDVRIMLRPDERPLDASESVEQL